MKTKMIIFWLGAASSIVVAADAPSSPPAKKENTIEHIEVELAVAKKVLARMRQRYKDEHPDVKAQLGTIAQLEQRLAIKKETPDTGVEGKNPNQNALANDRVMARLLRH